MASPKRLPDRVGAQVYDLQQVVSGAGEQLSSVVVQVQRRDSTQELQLPYDTLSPEKAKTHTQRIMSSVRSRMKYSDYRPL